jgi:hypothetical protein
VAGEHIVDLRIIEKSTSSIQIATPPLTFMPNYGQQAPLPMSMPVNLPAPLNLPPDPAIISVTTLISWRLSRLIYIITAIP